jgi:tetratricopeptide (TPR) repeat protein
MAQRLANNNRAATVSFERALLLDPDNVEAAIYFSDGCQTLGEPLRGTEALSACNELLASRAKKRPFDASLFLQRASLFRYLRDPQNELRMTQEALKRARTPEVLLQATNALVSLAKDDQRLDQTERVTDQSRRKLLSWLRQPCLPADIYQALATVSLLEGDRDAARSYLELGLRVAPTVEIKKWIQSDLDSLDSISGR